MKTFHILVFLITSLFLTACVSNKVFTDLESRYAELKASHTLLKKKYDSLQVAHMDLEKALESKTQILGKTLDSLVQQRNDFSNLQKAYDALQENSEAALQESINKNNALLAEISQKEQLLTEREARLNELEGLIADKEQAMNELKQRLSDALLNFEGKGLTVEQRNGKVYVSMENKLLFRSGSWEVGEEGREAIAQLGNVLADNPDIGVLIEGHTDDVPYSGKGSLKGNWDLSAKRATAIVKLLEQNPEILSQNLTAAGRGEFIPIAPNSTMEGRAANRRIEVILSPNLDAITDLLNND
ncbi:MAG: cell envelope biogenesis protein OmpA [Flavobacteriaceae bacterium TMED120]|nr:MAG: cell envelope biogenesis protein OmpA [Flavobacteriaceae bacterium TMED120]CAI8202556.1 MAG: putative lipoprotein YiaD [Flavobacteriaceae bacterium]HCQ24049.1 cell envelope biogenesis protein OmpA [Flavobacteriaceae bacterium]|tara:strand:+ start:304 stop:1203 length:900 start_codon:yes stop_codon:yes gene_type:complete